MDKSRNIVVLIFAVFAFIIVNSILAPFFQALFGYTGFESFTRFMVSLAVGVVIYQRFANSKKENPITASVPSDSSKLTSNKGYLVIRYKGDFWNKHTADHHQIIKALGSKHPLDFGSVEYLSNLYGKNLNREDLLDDKEIRDVLQFDGHLYIGGELYWDGQGHLLTVGPNRSGKGSSLVIPALISKPICYPLAPSFVILDPKGENIAITRRFLKGSGYNVICINPFGIPEIAEFGNSGFNVFDTFSASDVDFDKYADMVANAIAPDTPKSHEHFRPTARAYISLYIRHMMTQDAEPKNFRTLYKWLRLEGDTRMDFLAQMAENMAFDGDVSSEALAIRGLLASTNKEGESTYSTIRTLTDSFKNQQLRESISKTDFDITRIAHEKTALFICMNPSDLEENQAWLRILFGSLMRSLNRNYSKERKLVMIMDEFIQMGYFKEFELFSNYASGLGAGITLWPIVQSLSDLKGLYPQSWERFVNNAIIKHFIKVGDNFTADYVSKRMPIVDKGTNEKPQREPLYRPDQVMNETDIIAFITNLDKPAILRNEPYWKTGREMLASPNPFR